jgi:heme exporter protein B
MDKDPSAAAAPRLGLIAGGQVSPTARLPASATRALLTRGLLLAWRRPGDAATSAGFYLLVAGLVSLTTAPLALPGSSVAGVAAWLGALLATLLAQQQGLREDAACGVLDQLRLTPTGVLGPVTALLAIQVVATAAPLLLATPVVAVFFGLSAAQALALMLSLCVGLPAVCVLAAFVAALTLASRASQASLGLLTLPLAVPMLLFGVRAADPASGPGALLLLAACSLAACALGPFAVALALSLEDEA